MLMFFEKLFDTKLIKQAFDAKLNCTIESTDSFVNYLLTVTN